MISNCSNNYGPFQFPEKLIPLFINNISRIINHSCLWKGKIYRDWLYVEDHGVLEKGRTGEVYNIGGNSEMTNIDIVRAICALLDQRKPLSNGKIYNDFITYVKDRPGHDFRYAIDSSKLQII